MFGIKYDDKKPDLIPYFKNIPFNKKDFKSKKSNIDIEYALLDYSLLPQKSIREITKILMHGEKKYNRDNWKYVKPFKLRYFRAVLRHLFQWYVLKEKYDQDTGLNHLAHAGCCLLFLLEKD